MNKIIHPFFVEKGRLDRSALRLIVLPMNYRVEIKSLNSRANPVVLGRIKDFSLNGLCFRLNSNRDLIYFQMKDKLRLRLFVRRNVIDIDIACIVRIDEEHGDIGVSFNIKDERMIKVDSANCLTSLVYDWLVDIIRTYGKIESSGDKNQIGYF